ncbi:MAG: hypothetical protein HGA23_11120 [Bacteroidales bacterium]|nr:hypothetical protein [Bacteroidales bacterium]
MAAGSDFSLALRSEGSVAAWGSNAKGQCTVPAGTDFTAIAAGYLHGLARKSNGSLAGWGDNGSIGIEVSGKVYIFGDGVNEVSQDYPPLAPRVGIVANMQANQVLEILLGKM